MRARGLCPASRVAPSSARLSTLRVRRVEADAAPSWTRESGALRSGATVGFSARLDDVAATAVALALGRETRFGREFMARAAAAGCDAFGERGEFHTLAHVWEVPREQALGHDIKGSGGGVQ